MAESGIGEGKIIIPESPYFAIVNVRIEPSKTSQGTGDEEDQESDKEENKPSTSGSFKQQDAINLSSKDNNYILSFSTNVVSETGDSAPQEDDIRISIVDRTGALIDSILGQLYADTVIVYSYGYEYGEMSEEMEATLKGYGSTITPQGERIDIQLTTNSSADAENSDENDTGTYSGSPSEIVKQIAEEEGWELGDIEPTKTQYETSSSTIASEDQKKQHEDFMNDYNTRMKDPAKWFAEQQKKREEEKKKNEFNVNDLLNPGNVLK